MVHGASSAQGVNERIEDGSEALQAVTERQSLVRGVLNADGQGNGAEETIRNLVIDKDAPLGSRTNPVGPNPAKPSERQFYSALRQYFNCQLCGHVKCSVDGRMACQWPARRMDINRNRPEPRCWRDRRVDTDSVTGSGGIDDDVELESKPHDGEWGEEWSEEEWEGEWLDDEAGSFCEECLGPVEDRNWPEMVAALGEDEEADVDKALDDDDFSKDRKALWSTICRP
jgi:hypothetical protein